MRTMPHARAAMHMAAAEEAVMNAPFPTFASLFSFLHVKASADQPYPEALQKATTKP
jgi:hypothetical protein